MKPIANNTAYLTIRKDVTRKDGTKSIILRVKIAGKKKDISLLEYCPIAFWDENKCQVKRSYPEADKVNQVINNKKNNAESIILRYKNNNTFLTLEEFESEIGYERTESFTKFIESEIKKEQQHKSKSVGTISSYKKYLSKLKRYKQTVLFNELTVVFLENYDDYMRNKLKNQQNTIHGSHKFIRTFLNRARAQGITKIYPFDRFKFKTEQTKREFLSDQELTAILNVYNTLPNNNMKKTLRPFLFCCYTGIRFTDVTLLKYKDINNGIITIKMHKTKEFVRIPVLDITKQFIDEQIHPEQAVFKVPCNQVANRHLKNACNKVGVKKNITFHCSRHTFATMALNNGIPIETIQKILGHRKLMNTQIYAKLQDAKVNQDMEDLNRLLNNKRFVSVEN